MANIFNRYKSLFIKASRNIYSVPKYKAKVVNVKTSPDIINAKLSIQNTIWESIMSKHENHFPKST